MKDKVTTARANKELEPLIEFAAKNRGTVYEVRRRLCKRTRKTWHADNVAKWLHKDPKKRGQPLLGVGLMLVEIGDEIMRENAKLKCGGENQPACGAETPRPIL